MITAATKIYLSCTEIRDRGFIRLVHYFFVEVTKKTSVLVCLYGRACRKKLSIVAKVWGYVSVEMRPLPGPLSVPQIMHEWIWSSSGILSGETRKTWRETCPSDFSSTTNSSWTILGVNPGLRGKKSAINSPRRSCFLGFLFSHKVDSVRKSSVFPHDNVPKRFQEQQY
jgi:hypothetical protein